MERVFVQWAIDGHRFEESFRLCDFLVQSYRVSKHKRVDALRESRFLGAAVGHGEVRLSVETADFLVYLFKIG